MIVSTIFKMPTNSPMHRPNSQLVHTHVRVSGGGCARDIDTAAESGNSIAVGRRNGGPSSTGVTVILPGDVDGKRTLPRCKPKYIMIQKEAKS